MQSLYGTCEALEACQTYSLHVTLLPLHVTLLPLHVTLLPLFHMRSLYGT